MAKLPRVKQKIFAQEAPELQVMQFGSLAAFDPVPTKDVSTLQALAAFSKGWKDAVMLQSSPTMEDFNGLFLLVTQQLAYILQEGVAEWDEDTVYYKGAIVKGDIYGTTFYCLEDDTLGVPVSNSSYWAVAGQGQAPLFVGACIWDAGLFAPLGFGELDGSILLIEDYPALYDRLSDQWATCYNPVLGGYYPAPPAGYFRLPDLRGVMPRNVGENADGTDVIFGAFLDDATAKNGLSNSSSTVTGTATQGSTAGTGGNHTHTTSGVAAQGATSAQGGPHTHGSASNSGSNLGGNGGTAYTVKYGSTGTGGAHSHVTGGTAAAGGGHSHALSATAAAQTISSTDVETRGKSVGMKLRIKLY